MDISSNANWSGYQCNFHKKKDDSLHRTQSPFLCKTSIETACLKALLTFHKNFFANLDKTKDLRVLNFPICLNQREVIYSMETQDIIF